MKFFNTTHLAGVGEFITAVSGSTGDYDLTLADGTVVEGYDETAGTFSTAAPVVGDLFLYGTDGAGRLLASADQDVIPAVSAAAFMRQKDNKEVLLVTSVPAHEAVDVAIDANVVLNFNTTVLIADSDGIVLSDTGTSTPVAGAVSVLNNVVTINPTGNLTNEEEYQVVIASDAITNLNGDEFAGVVAGALTFTCIAA
jgi:hypothetical protein